MGLKQFWAQLYWQRSEETVSQVRLDHQLRIHKANIVVYERELDKLSSNLTTKLDPIKSNTSSRKRKSWFGGRPVHDSSVPAVPTLNLYNLQQPQAVFIADKYYRQAVPITTAVQEEKRKSRRISLSHKISLRSIRDKYNHIEALPPLPAMHTTTQRSTDMTAQPAEQRKSRPASLSRKWSEDSTKSAARRRISIWESSNPDNFDDEVPSVPALVRDGSRSPESYYSREYRRKDSKHDVLDQASQAKHAVHRRTYTPRNAAAGFLASTSGASDATRKSFRKSFHIADGADLVCATDEQRREWEKLKFTSHTAQYDLEQYDLSDDEDQPKYSNKQALAALEFGLR